MTDPALFRLTDLYGGMANSAKAKQQLGWEAKVNFEQMIEAGL